MRVKIAGDPAAWSRRSNALGFLASISSSTSLELELELSSASWNFNGYISAPAPRPEKIMLGIALPLSNPPSAS